MFINYNIYYMAKITFIFFLSIFFIGELHSKNPKDEFTLISKTLVWDSGKHCAFTDMVEWKGTIYLCFREGSKHVPLKVTDYGAIRILSSSDGINWKEFEYIEDSVNDLRDPKLFVTPSGQLMLLCGYSKLINGKLKLQGTLYSFLTHDNYFLDLKPIIDNVEHTSWLWNMAWSDDCGYGIAYKGGYKAVLLKTTNGINWNVVTDFDLNGSVTEAALQIVNKEMKVVLRRDKMETLIGESIYPYLTWSWESIYTRLESPCILPINKKQSLLAGRCIYNNSRETSVFIINKDNSLKRIFTLDVIKKGDSAYPGIVKLKNTSDFLVSYYTGDYGKASIYVARIRKR